jgi:shikimate kinase
MADTQHIHRILLTGFMGAGKTTVGILLAERLGWRFLDLDQHLESQHKCTIAELFAQHGEPHFRALESDSLASVLSAQSIVIALGGGALEAPANRAAIAQSQGTALVYLHAALDTLMQRIDTQPNAPARPKLATRESTTALHAARLPHYRTASLHIDTTSLTPHEVAQRILSALHLHTLRQDGKNT